MKRTSSDTELEVWDSEYVNFPSTRYGEDDKTAEILQIEPASEPGYYIVEIRKGHAPDEESETPGLEELLIDIGISFAKIKKFYPHIILTTEIDSGAVTRSLLGNFKGLCELKDIDISTDLDRISVQGKNISIEIADKNEYYE